MLVPFISPLPFLTYPVIPFSQLIKFFSTLFTQNQREDLNLENFTWEDINWEVIIWEGLNWEDIFQKKPFLFVNYSARSQDGPQEMERN